MLRRGRHQRPKPLYDELCSCRLLVPTHVDIDLIEKLLGLIQLGKKYSPRGFLPSWPRAVRSSVAPWISLAFAGDLDYSCSRNLHGLAL
jgi:hypothetical protein